MPPSPPVPADEDFFNDLSQQAPNAAASQDSTEARRSSASAELHGAPGDGDDAQSRPKRIACVLCRKRKLRCDGARPACATCKRLSHDCAYDEVRKKSGPKRGYVKLLEARLQQVETLLKNQDPMTEAPRRENDNSLPQTYSIPTRPNPTSTPSSDNVSASMGGLDSGFLQSGAGPPSDPNLRSGGAGGSIEPSSEDSSWEMIGLGLEEPLPLQDTINDLHRIYFEKIHPSIPIIHRPRYLAAMNLAPQMRPPVSLRYMMWCMAASVTDKYEAMQEHFYHRARKYLQMDEMRGHGESIITVGICQAWLLVGMYEFKLMFFPRAWMSVGRAARLAQMMGLHRLDGAGLDVKQCIPPPRDWTEREERRRTFWFAFCEDRYASIGTGWPMIVDERDIMTNLPASEDAFDKSKPTQTTSLADAMKPGGAAGLTQLGGVVLMACLFGRNLTHLHRPTPEDQEDDLEGAFWQRHREMERILANTGLSLPDNLRLPAGLPDANVIFLNMNIHTSAICLHQAAIFKADRHKLPANVGSESRVRCMTAAAEIARIMRMLVHLDLSTMNPFISFCLYVAARVFVQYLKFRPKDQQMISSLQFLLTAMHALKKKNPLTESFIVQLDLDLAGAGIDVGQPKIDYYTSAALGEIPVNMDSVRCSPIVEIRDSQQPVGHAARTRSEKSVPAYSDMAFVHNNPNTETPGPPFHIARAGVDMSGSGEEPFAYLNAQPNQSSLMSNYTMDGAFNQAGACPGAAASSFSPSGLKDNMDTTPDNNDHATPSTDVSRQNSTARSSHTSYSPPHQSDPSKTGHILAPGLFSGTSLASSSTANTTNPVDASMSSAVPLGPATATTAADQAFFPAPNQGMDFSNMHTGFSPATGFELPGGPAMAAGVSGDDFTLGGWDISMGGGSGLTPLAEPNDMNWQNVMEGWNNMGPGHQTDVFGRRV